MPSMPFFGTYEIHRLAQAYHDWLNSFGFDPDDRQLLGRVIGVAVLVLLCWIFTSLVRFVLVKVLGRVVNSEKGKLVKMLYEAKVLRKGAALTPVIVIVVFGHILFPGDAEMGAILQTIVELYTIFVLVWLANSALSAFYNHYKNSKTHGHIELQALVQAVKLLIIITGVLLALSIIAGQSPIYFLSGLGAATAVLMLVFKDPILGLVAGIQINVYNMVRVGDWINMPEQNANGYVIDISLTNVKVSNWDKTITSVPTYTLISQSFINWRGMFDAGGRRIKENLHLDLRTVRYADNDLLERMSKVTILKDWLAGRLEEIKQANEEKGGESGDPVIDALNGRRLTNVGLFRQYVVEYLKSDDRVYTDGSFTFLVRYLPSEDRGLPLQIYVFTKTTVWAEYENVMSDIFDHFYATAPLFGLAVYQMPSGQDLQDMTDALEMRPEPR